MSTMAMSNLSRSSGLATAMGRALRGRRKCVVVAVLVMLIVVAVFHVGDFWVADDLPVICVVGYHHSGTSLLRHMLGSHPDAEEVAEEQMPAVYLLNDARARAKANGKSFVVIKKPVNDMSKKSQFLTHLSLSSNVHVVKIQRDRADVIYSISKRSIHLNITEQHMEKISGTIDEIYGDFMPKSPSITLEDLSSNTRGTLQRVCAQLPISFHPSMLDYWKTPFLFDNRGKQAEAVPADLAQLDAREDHDKLRVAEINQPVHPAEHTWLADASLSPEQKDLLRRYASY